MELSEEHRGPGFVLRYPDEADLRTGETRTRTFGIVTAEVAGPWKQSPRGEASRYRVTVHAYERLDDAPAGDLLESASVPRDRSRYRWKEGSFRDRPATLREPRDPERRDRAAYFAAGPRFFFVEWEGPAEPILASLRFGEEG